MLDHGMRACVNSDDPAYFPGYMNENLAAVQAAAGLAREEIVQLARNAFTIAWLGDEERAGYLARSTPTPRGVRALPLIGVLLVAGAVAASASAHTKMSVTLLGRTADRRGRGREPVGHARCSCSGASTANETAGIAVARALERLSPRDLDLWIVPDLNPDGVAAGTRHNAHGVDLNRNFPVRWRPMGGVYASGPRAAVASARRGSRTR